MRDRARLLCPLLLAAALGCSDEQTAARPARCEGAPRARAEGEIRIAGSGASLAPVARIAARFEELHPDSRVHVAQSIGTGGAVRALADGAIDIGLASRALTAEERSLGLEAHPFARVALAPTVHEHVPRTAISTAELAAIFRGETERWPDGTAVVPLLRQPGDSAMRAIEQASPELRAALSAARDGGRALTRYTDQEVRDTLLAVPGAIGFLDVGTVALEAVALRPLAIDGVSPTAGAVRDGRYPFVLTLSLVTRADASEAVRELTALATSDELVELIAADGFIRVPPAPDGGE